MKLTTMHQVLIVGAIGLGAILSLRSLWLYSRGGEVREVLLGAMGAALSVGLTVYLRRFRRKLRLPGAPPVEEAT